MNMDQMVEQSIEAAAKIMGIPFDEAIVSKEAQEMAFKLTCAAMTEQTAH